MRISITAETENYQNIGETFKYYISITNNYMLVIDSSSLISLAKVGLLDLSLSSLKETPMIPPEVYNESVLRKETVDSLLIQTRIQDKKIIIKKVPERSLYNKLAYDFNLGKGEAEAIALCVLNQGILMTDDKKAINTCRALKVPFITVANVLITLHKKKKINREEAYDLLDKLQKYKRYSREVTEKIKGDLQ